MGISTTQITFGNYSLLRHRIMETIDGKPCMWTTEEWEKPINQETKIVDN